MSEITSFSLLGVELVRLAGKWNVVNANGASIHNGLFRDALSTQVDLDRKAARFIISPIVADEWMDYVRLSDSVEIIERNHNRCGGVEFLIVGWLPDDVMLLARPEEIVFRPFSSKRFLSFSRPTRVTLVKNIGRAEKQHSKPHGIEPGHRSTLGPHFIDWMKEHHPDVPLDAVPQSVASDYFGAIAPSTEGDYYDLSAVGGKEN